MCLLVHAANWPHSTNIGISTYRHYTKGFLQPTVLRLAHSLLFINHYNEHYDNMPF